MDRSEPQAPNSVPKLRIALHGDVKRVLAAALSRSGHWCGRHYGPRWWLGQKAEVESRKTCDTRAAGRSAIQNAGLGGRNSFVWASA